MPTLAIVTCLRATPTPRFAQDFLPSINRTITVTERKMWRIRLYLCIDIDDPMYADPQATANTSSLLPGIEVHRTLWTRILNVIPNAPTCELAFAEGADYVHRTNDDTVYHTPAWITSATSALRAFGDVGVVGPKTWGDGFRPGLLTLDMTHRTHMRIFAAYYPQVLSNWFVDDWISVVYGNRSRRVRAWETTHHFAKRRYTPATRQHKLLPSLLECGRAAVAAYLRDARAHVPVLCGGSHVRPVQHPSCQTALCVLRESWRAT